MSPNMQSIRAPRPLASLVAAFILWSALPATAAQPDAWNRWNCYSCHGAGGTSGARPDMTTWPTSGLSDVGTEDFAVTLRRYLKDVPGPMLSLADTTTIEGAAARAADRAAIMQYLLDARDGKIRALDNGGESTSKDLSFGSGVIATTPRTRVISITNERSKAITYNAELTDDPSFIVKSDDCAAGVPSPRSYTGTVPAGGTCNLTLSFEPAAPLASERVAHLGITLNAAPGDIAFRSVDPFTLHGAATANPLGTLVFSPPKPFPATALGATSVQTLTLGNSGEGSLTFTSPIDVTGPNANDFLPLAGSCMSTTVLAKDAAPCTLTVTFRPSALGPRSAKLVIEHDGIAPSRVEVDLSVALPSATLAPASVDFGTQALGGLYPTQRLTFTNAGNVPLTGVAVSVQGLGFSQTTSCPSRLEAGSPCSIDVQFSPPAVGANYRGEVRVASSAPGAPAVAALSGAGVAAARPSLQWADGATQLDFGSVLVGNVSDVRSVRLANPGPGGARLSVINSIDADSSMFVVVSDRADPTACQGGATLYQGSECHIDVRFAPTASGARRATLQVGSDGAPAPAFALVGTALTGTTPGLALAPAVLSLDNTRVGSLSAPAEVTIRNAGATPLTVSGVAVSGPFTVSDKTCPATPFSLAAGAACTATLTFAPVAEGLANGSFTVTSNASPASQSVQLTATGEPAYRNGGGGCSMVAGRGATDPTLWLLVLLALVALHMRERRRAWRQAVQEDRGQGGRDTGDGQEGGRAP